MSTRLAPRPAAYPMTALGACKSGHADDKSVESACVRYQLQKPAVLGDPAALSQCIDFVADKCISVKGVSIRPTQEQGDRAFLAAHLQLSQARAGSAVHSKTAHTDLSLSKWAFGSQGLELSGFVPGTER